MIELLEVGVGVLGRLVAWVFIEILYEFVFYAVGYPVVKLVTLGKHPRGFGSGFGSFNSFVSLVGLLVVVGLVCAVFVL